MKKEKRRLVLSGSDDAYAQREAVPDKQKVPSLPAPDSPPSQVAHEVPSQEPPCPAGGLFSVTQSVHKAKHGSHSQPAGGTLQVNYRLNIGKELTPRLLSIAEAHDQPIELILKGIRNRTADRFKLLASGSKKPSIPVPARGGLSIRYAVTFSDDQARNLNQWFDPFDLGIAKDACKPILIGLFQDETKALCDAVE